MHRSDYMVDTFTSSLLQIELNTIASSFAGLTSLVSRLHTWVSLLLHGYNTIEATVLLLHSRRHTPHTFSLPGRMEAWDELDGAFRER